MTRPRSSIRIGTRNPNAAMLSAIWRICFFECVLALRALGLSASTEIHFIMTMSPCYDAKAQRVRCDLRRLQTKLLRSSGSDLIHADRIAHLQALACPSDCQPFWQLAVPGIAGVTSPAGITCRPDRQRGPKQSLGCLSPPLLLEQRGNFCQGGF